MSPPAYLVIVLRQIVLAKPDKTLVFRQSSHRRSQPEDEHDEIDASHRGSQTEKSPDGLILAEPGQDHTVEAPGLLARERNDEHVSRAWSNHAGCSDPSSAEASVNRQCLQATVAVLQASVEPYSEWYER